MKKSQQPEVSEAQHKAALARILKLERRFDAAMAQLGGAVNFTFVDPTNEDADA